MNESESLPGPQLRHASLMALIGYLMSFGVPYASFSILPKLFVAGDAGRTAQNVAAHQGQLVFVIFAFLINFIGDIVAAWGLYLLLKPVNASVSMFVAWLRVAFAALGIAAVQNLVTAHRIITRPAALAALGQAQLDAQVHLALGAFSSQFAFSLILFGLYLVLLGWLFYRASYLPRWLGFVLAIAGAGWMIMEAGPYLFPQVDFGVLFFTSFGELILIVWLIGWGLRLKPPGASGA